MIQNFHLANAPVRDSQNSSDISKLIALIFFYITPAKAGLCEEQQEILDSGLFSCYLMLFFLVIRNELSQNCTLRNNIVLPADIFMGHWWSCYRDAWLQTLSASNQLDQPINYSCYYMSTCSEVENYNLQSWRVYLIYMLYLGNLLYRVLRNSKVYLAYHQHYP